MKGLLLKDFYTLLKQSKLFILIIIVFAFVPEFSFTAFAIVYSAMMPITALAYDERSGWDHLAAMMPYKTEDIVLEKYVLGYLSVGFSGIICLLVRFIYHIVGGGEWGTDLMLPLLLYLCVATLLLAINLPLMFKVGVEKGRIAFLALTVIIVLSVTAMGDQLLTTIKTAKPSLLVIILLLITAIINIISIMMSIRFYRSKNR